MADPSNLADYLFYQYQRPHPAPPVTSANGAPGANDDDEGSNASDGWHAYAAPSSPSVGRQTQGQKKHVAPARSRENWLSYAAFMAAQGAAGATNSASHSTSRLGNSHHRYTTASNPLPPQQRPYPPQPPLAHNPVNRYDHRTPDPHLSCPLCGTPYQRSPSGQEPLYVPRPRDAMNQHEQTRVGPQCPACHCPTRTQLSPTSAPTRFTSTGRREYITGYPSPQQYLGGVATANANTNSTSPPYRSPASSYRAVARTGTSGLGWQVSPADSRTSERTSQVTRTQPQNYPLQPPPPPIRESLHNAAYIPFVSVGAGVYSAPVPAASEQRATCVTPRVTSAPLPLNSADRESPHNAINITSASAGTDVHSRPAPAASEQRATRVTPRVTNAPLSSNSVTSMADGAEAAYSGSTTEALISDMIVKGFIKSDAIADVMRAVDRTNYVTDKAKAYSPVTHVTEQGVAVPAPHIVRIAHVSIGHRGMLTDDADTTARGYLESIMPHIKARSHVLDVGASTGLFAAMLHHCTGEDGVTVSLQSSDEVIESAKQNLTSDGFEQALQMGRMLLVKGDEESGYELCAPYDVIHVTKVMEDIPPLLLTQLASPGRMVIPVQPDGCDVTMVQIDKDATGKYRFKLMGAYYSG